MNEKNQNFNAKLKRISKQKKITHGRQNCDRLQQSNENNVLKRRLFFFSYRNRNNSFFSVHAYTYMNIFFCRFGKERKERKNQKNINELLSEIKLNLF